MKLLQKFIIPTFTIIYLFNFQLLSAGSTQFIQTEIDSILSKMPANSFSKRDSLMNEILQFDKNGIIEICNRLVPPGTGDDTQARYALSGLAFYLNQNDFEPERNMYAETLIQVLKSSNDKDVQAFLVEQLKFAGKDDVIKPLSKFLNDDSLCEPAAQALMAIGIPKVEGVFLKALASAKGKNRITIVKALGDLRSTKATKKILNDTKSQDAELRQTAMYALANIGDPSANKLLSKMNVAASSAERAKVPALYLLYAQRLAESGNHDKTESICRTLIGSYNSPQESGVQCSALSLLVNTIGENAFDDLLAVMDESNSELVATSLALAPKYPGEKYTSKWLEKMSTVSSETKAMIVNMLGHRGDKTALPAILTAFDDSNKVVRLAAISAAARLGKKEVIPDLLIRLQNGDNDEVIEIKRALLSITAIDDISQIAEAIPANRSFGKAALLEIIAERHASDYIDLIFDQTESTNDTIRIAAMKALNNLVKPVDLSRLINLLMIAEDSTEISTIQQTIVTSVLQIPQREFRAKLLLEKLKTIKDKKRTRLFSPLSKIGNEQALQIILAESENQNPEIQYAAIHALSEWQDIDAANELLQLSQATQNPDHRRILLDGYVRLVGQSDISAEMKSWKFKEALAATSDTMAIRNVLKALPHARTVGSLYIAAQYLDDKAFQKEAAQSALRIVMPINENENQFYDPLLISVLNRLIRIYEESYEKERLEKRLRNVLDQNGFVALFNGKDLTGWKGLVENPVKRSQMTREELSLAQAEADSLMRAHWSVKNGVLVFDGNGHSLCTAKDYGDFEMLVDWKIQKDGDSGIYLRGSPQVQIWDTAQWPEGSGGLYNNKRNPSQPLKCADNPIGEWNSFRIIMMDERVTVYLNDMLVVDNVVMENYWERDKPIYPIGQIELQAHSTPLYFRNIYIREIKEENNVRELTAEETKEGFERLFNGTDLTGWTGDTVGYIAENKKIVMHPEKGGGNLYTEQEFSDFILRFEFKLTPGANNGLGIRAPLQGDAAYVGMELQILDDSANKHKDLKPYQFHGSIYGLVSSKRGFQKPVGEWNFQEVIAMARQITVKLNGETIVDANIDEASTPHTIDGREHPGLKREKGRIGFLGHGSHVEFRNVMIKALNKK